MILERAFLAALLGWALTGLYAYKLHADVVALRPAKAAIKDAERVANEYRVALQACNDAKAKLQRQVEQAQRDAERARQQADQSADDFEQRRTNAPPACDEIRKARVCPILMDY